MYFLGQEDRNMKNGLFGIGDYIYIEDQFYPIESYNPSTQMLYTNKIHLFDKNEHLNIREFYLDTEPSRELFMEILGNDWDTIYKQVRRFNEDYTDYVPVFYSTREDFVNNKGTWYNK